MTTLPEERGEVITFYSYKGGTGRSMALSNVACLLAEQKPVLMVDWDLEAPGLHRFFYKMLPGPEPEQYLKEKPGLIDLLYEIEARLPPMRKGKVGVEDEKATAALVEQIDLDRFITPLTRPNLSLLKAGSLNESYSQRVNTFRWEPFFERAPSLFRLFAERLCRKFDYVLVDSRTGLTDISGICTMLLPEKLVVVFTPNSQSLTGIRELVQRALRYRRGSEDMRPLLVFPLPSRIEASLDKQRISWRFGNEEQGIVGFQPMFEALLQEVYRLEECHLGKYFDEAQIQQAADYAYGEEIAVLAPEQEDRFSLNRSYRTFTEYLTKPHGPWLLQKPREVESRAPDSLLEQLIQATERLDREGAERLCNEFITQLHQGEEVPVAIARKVLRTLRRKCYFDLMERVAEAFRLTGQDDPQIRLLYAQSLVDQGKIPVALGVIETLIAQTVDEADQAEARGLLGRIYKQLYVSAVNADPGAATRKLIQLNLQRAVDAYSAVYRFDPQGHLWQGINLVALLWRATRDMVPTPADFPDPKQLARDILGFIEKKGIENRLDHWDLATAAEACIALGRHEEALEWIRLYINDESKVDAFELSSMLRQLTEVWKLTPETEPGASLLPPLQAAALDRQGGGIDLGPGELGATIQSAKNLDRNFGNEGFVFLPWYIQGLERCKAVAQVRTETGDGFGTGFLIRGGDIAPALGDEVLLLTNAHVVSNDPEVLKQHGSLFPEEAVIVFEAQGHMAMEYRVAKLLWTSAPEDLDATLLRLDKAVPDTKPCPLAAALPQLNTQPPQKIYIIGHPRGGKLTFSIYDNHLLDYDDRLIHYRAPTERDSAGSPVFNQQWKLIALHHAGDKEIKKLNGQPGTYAANEGILIQKISEAVKAAGIA